MSQNQIFSENQEYSNSTVNMQNDSIAQPNKNQYQSIISHDNIDQIQLTQVHQNNQQHVVDIGQQNLDNMIYPYPEMVYCNEDIKGAKKFYNSEVIGEEGLIYALRLVQRDLNLNIDCINIIGKCSILQPLSIEKNIINPIISNNSHIPSQQIKFGKLMYCCNYIHTLLLRISGFIILHFLLSLFFQGSITTKFYLRYQQDQEEKIEFIIQVIQLNLHIISYLLFCIGMTKCLPLLVIISDVCLQLNFLFALYFIIIFEFMKQRDINVVFTGMICFNTALGYFLMIFVHAAKEYIKRLCVLLKQQHESTLLNLCF